MFKRIFLSLLLSASLGYAAADTASPGAAHQPSEASIKQLLEVAQARKLADSVMTQMDNFMQQAMAQATQGQTIPAKVQKQIDQGRSEMMALMKELLDWNKLEPMYVRIYQKNFTQAEVDGMIVFYKTPAGAAVINKMPTVMQNAMDEMQQLMGPVMQKIQQTQQAVSAEMKAQSKNKGG